MWLLWPFSHIFFSAKLCSPLLNIVRQFFKKGTLILYSPTSKIRKNLWWKTMRYVLNMMKEQWEASSLEGHHNLCNASLNTSTSHLWWSSDMMTHIKNVSKWIRMSKCLVSEPFKYMMFSPRWVFSHLFCPGFGIQVQTWLEKTNLGYTTSYLVLFSYLRFRNPALNKYLVKWEIARKFNNCKIALFAT